MTSGRDQGSKRRAAARAAGPGDRLRLRPTRLGQLLDVVGHRRAERLDAHLGRGRGAVHAGSPCRSLTSAMTVSAQHLRRRMLRLACAVVR